MNKNRLFEYNSLGKLVEIPQDKINEKKQNGPHRSLQNKIDIMLTEDEISSHAANQLAITAEMEDEKARKASSLSSLEAARQKLKNLGLTDQELSAIRI